MHNTHKDWLVRTRSGEILGPFSERELVLALRDGIFSAQDEIARSSSNWVSAQGLLYREIEEGTAAHTKSQLSLTSPTEKTRTQTEPLVETNLARALEPAARPLPPRWIGLLSAGILGVLMLWILAPPQTRDGAKDLGPVAAGPARSPILEEVNELIRSGRFTDALALLAKTPATQREKDPGALLTYYALQITQRDASDSAKEQLEVLMSSPGLSPDLKARAHHWLGFLQLRAGTGDLGEGHFLEALQLNPREAASRYNLGRAYLKQKRPQQALDYLQLAELEVPHLWLVHIYKARAKSLLGRKEDAELSFRRAIDVAPDRWMSYLYFALFLQASGSDTEASNTLVEMLKRDPFYDSNTAPPLGFFEERIPLSEYLDTFREISQHGPDRELGLLYLGALAAGPKSPAARKLLLLAPDSSGPGASFKLQLLLQRQEHEKMERALAQIPVENATTGYLALTLKAEALVQLRKFAEAISASEQALRLEPRAARARLIHAVALKASGKIPQGQTELTKLLADEPNYTPAVVESNPSLGSP